MNNSLPCLLEGMAQALREHVVPATEGEFARGQIFGVIFMLNSLAQRTSWSPAFLGQQIAHQRTLAASLPPLPPDAPRIEAALPGTDDQQAARDTTDRAVCALIDWLANCPAALSATDARIAEAAIAAYLSRQIRFELTTSARPMFREISLGTDKEAE